MSPAPSLPSNMTEPNTSTSLWARFEQLVASDAAKNELITVKASLHLTTEPFN